MQHSCLPLKGQINSFNHCIKFGQIDVPRIINWTQPTGIFNNASIYTQCPSRSHGTCFHPDLHLFTIYAPVSPDRILLTYSDHCFRQHSTERGISDFIVLVLSVLAWHLINAVATLIQPHTGKWPTIFPHGENMHRRVTMQGISGILLPRFNRRKLFSSQTCRPRTLAPSLNCLGSLQTLHNLRSVVARAVQKPYVRQLKCRRLMLM